MKQKIKKLTEINDIIDKIIKILETKLFIDGDISEKTDNTNENTNNDNDQNN